MSMTMEDTDLRDLINSALPCQGQEHPAGTLGHDGGPGAFLLIAPCKCMPWVLQCAGRVKHMRAHPSGVLGCSKCATVYPLHLWRFIPV